MERESSDRRQAAEWAARFPPIPPVGPPTPDDFIPGAIRADEPAAPRAVVEALPSPPPPALATGHGPDHSRTAPEKDPRIVVRGRVATAPEFGTTPKGQARALFRLAEHPDPDTTVYRRVRLFGTYVDRFRDVLVKGTEVEVVGYEHTYQVTGKDGQPVQQTIINAVAVRK